MEKQLSKEESLSIIAEMIATAKEGYAGGGSFYFLLWGWLIALANFTHYVMDKYTAFEYPYVVWVVIIPGIIVSAMRGKTAETAGVTTHLGRLYLHLWIGIGIGIFLTLIFMSRIGYNHNALILTMAGIGTYISGQVIRFRPLVAGAFALWAGTIVCFMVPVMEQYLVSATAIVLGYLIPGYLLKRIEK